MFQAFEGEVCEKGCNEEEVFVFLQPTKTTLGCKNPRGCFCLHSSFSFFFVEGYPTKNKCLINLKDIKQIKMLKLYIID